jgi:hypothetical protein
MRPELILLGMALVIPSKEKPAWLEEARNFCRSAGIEIIGWGPDLLSVEAKSPDRAKEIASQLGNLGFKVVENEDNDYAGILDLSRNPAAVQAQIASFDISRRPWDEQVEPLIWAILMLSLGLAWKAGRYTSWIALPLGLLSIALFAWDGIRIWGWRLEMVPEALRVQRHFRWCTIPWEQIRAVQSIDAAWGRGQESVVVKLASHSSERLGTFDCAFSRNLRDRLRYELAQRRREQ